MIFNYSGKQLQKVHWFEHISRRQIVLLLSTMFCLGMQFFRIIYTGSFFFSMLVWNLFLALLPLLISSLMLKIQPKKWYFFLLPGLVWLLFLPNAPYILTDFVHLDHSGSIPKWFDLMLIMSFSWMGLLYWLISMFQFNALIRRWEGFASGFLINQSVILLTSVGVYLGRFERYNSWDVFFTPFEILEKVGLMIFHPADYPGFFGMTAAIHIFLSLLFYFFYNAVSDESTQILPFRS